MTFPPRGSSVPCATFPDLFFAPDMERPPDRRSRERDAKSLCARCSLRGPCLTYAQQEGVLGIWGGTTEEERGVRSNTSHRRLRPPPTELPTPDPRCGTIAGYTAHRWRGEATCRECHEAHRLYQKTPEQRLRRTEWQRQYRVQQRAWKAP